MKVCRNCGTRNFDIDTTCGKCHAPLMSKVDKALGVQPVFNTQGSIEKVAVPQNNGLSITAKVFLIIACVYQGIAALTCLIILLSTGVIINAYGGGPEGFAWLYFIIMSLCVAHVVISICMTSSYFGKLYERKKIGTAFKVLTLIFVDLVAGILMLCDEDHP